MGNSRKSYGTRSDKETQSPVLKIFRDMMQKDNDPERAKLLKEKHKEKKKKYSDSRTKIDQRIYDSSSTDRFKQTKHNPITVQDINEERSEYDYRKRSEPFQGEKKESWWFSNDSNVKKQKKVKSADTYSCVSCALKRILGSECACITFLVVVFLVSISVAFLLVFKAVPSTKLPDIDVGDSMLKKIQMIKEKRQLNDDYGKVYKERPSWERPLAGRYDIPSIISTDDNKINFRHMSLPGRSASDELTNLLSADEIMSSNNEKLRDFYKRLLETDAQIQKLKENVFNNYNNKNDRIIGDRFKRSFERKLLPDSGPPGNARARILHPKDQIRDKRFSNKSNITGFVISEEKFVVKYDPIKRKNNSKLYHARVEMPHEEHLKHPFYKNIQRIYEVLTQNKKTTIKDSKTMASEKTEFQNNFNSERITKSYKDIYNEIKVENKLKDQLTVSYPIEDRILSSTSPSNVELDDSPSIDGNFQDLSRYSTYMSHRKLLQVDREDQEEMDEDLKKIVRDQKQNFNVLENKNERSRRDYLDLSTRQVANWKESKPLNPHALNFIIRQAALQNLNIKVPIDTKDYKPEVEREENYSSDTQYVEDYLENKYNKMVKMAQAYSDYGVLNEKKDSMADKVEISNKNRTNNLIDNGFVKNSIDRLRKGIRNNNPQIKLLKSLEKHIKISRDPIPDNSPVLINENYEQNDHNELHETQDSTTSKSYLEKTFSVEIRKNGVLNGINKDNEMLFGEDAENSKRNLNDKTAPCKEVPDNIINKNISSLPLVEDKFFQAVVDSRKLTTESPANHRFFKGFRHRSRILMAYNENGTTINDMAPATDNVVLIGNKIITPPPVSVPSKDTFDDTLPIILTVISENQDKIVQSKRGIMNESSLNRTNIKDYVQNKTVVKRNADNFVFWNELYDDDEYGVKLDYIDRNIMRDKHNTKKNNVEKSRDWIRGKLDKLMGKMNKSNKTVAGYNFTCRKNIEGKSSKKTSRKRKIRNLEFDEGNDMENIFKKLTANMKKVCKEAANAIQNTKNIEVRDSKEELATSSLMQRLVRLMTDLVDIQVQEKTCAKLPPDLQKFLEWLTAPAETHPQVDNLNPDISDYIAANKDYGGRYEKSTEFPSLTEDTHQEDRTECLGTIQAVHDLVEEYEGLSNEDKSKMSGVKEYLERQLAYLNKIAGYDDNIYKLYRKRDIRYKRETNRTKEKPKLAKKGFGEIIRKFRKKKSKTAATAVSLKTTSKDMKGNKSERKPQARTKVQRNLNDIYYRALEEAKKATATDSSRTTIK